MGPGRGSETDRINNRRRLVRSAPPATPPTARGCTAVTRSMASAPVSLRRLPHTTAPSPCPHGLTPCPWPNPNGLSSPETTNIHSNRNHVPRAGRSYTYCCHCHCLGASLCYGYTAAALIAAGLPSFLQFCYGCIAAALTAVGLSSFLRSAMAV